MFGEATAEREGALLVGWLRLLGWQVEVSHVGNSWMGIARRFDGYGNERVITGRAFTHGAVAFELFQSAFGRPTLQLAA